MHWCSVAAVQEVAAVIVRGPGVVDDVLRQLAAKSALFGALRIDHGADWIAVFAALLPDDIDAGETVLPAIKGVPLYEDDAGWLLPIGVEIAAPAQARPSLREALAKSYDVVGPAIVVPRFADAATITHEADVYAIGTAIPLARYRLPDAE